jgi:hypothetical protein
LYYPLINEKRINSFSKNHNPQPLEKGILIPLGNQNYKAPFGAFFCGKRYMVLYIHSLNFAARKRKIL